MRQIPGLTLLRTRNPYLAIVYGSMSAVVLNQPHAILSALNRLSWMQKFGPPYAVVSSDHTVEKVELERPWVTMTAWRLGLDGVVTSVEGAKSVVEHRLYMRNPLAKVSVLVPKPRETVYAFATVKTADGVVGELLRYLGLHYAGVTLGRYGGEMRVIDVDPVPPLSREEAELVVELL